MNAGFYSRFDGTFSSSKSVFLFFPNMYLMNSLCFVFLCVVDQLNFIYIREKKNKMYGYLAWNCLDVQDVASYFFP